MTENYSYFPKIALKSILAPGAAFSELENKKLSLKNMLFWIFSFSFLSFILRESDGFIDVGLGIAQSEIVLPLIITALFFGLSVVAVAIIIWTILRKLTKIGKIDSVSLFGKIACFSAVLLFVSIIAMPSYIWTDGSFRIDLNPLGLERTYEVHPHHIIFALLMFNQFRYIYNRLTKDKIFALASAILTVIIIGSVNISASLFVTSSILEPLVISLGIAGATTVTRFTIQSIIFDLFLIIVAIPGYIELKKRFTNDK